MSRSLIAFEIFLSGTHRAGSLHAFDLLAPDLALRAVLMRRDRQGIAWRAPRVEFALVPVAKNRLCVQMYVSKVYASSQFLGL